jgi:hypothetical protein
MEPPVATTTAAITAGTTGATIMTVATTGAVVTALLE